MLKMGPVASLKKAWSGLAGVFKMLRTPALREEAQGHLEQMKRDGVDPANAAARQSWIRAHRKDLRDLQAKEPATTVARATPKIGRNDPCSCSSGKKHKKCCGS